MSSKPALKKINTPKKNTKVTAKPIPSKPLENIMVHPSRLGFNEQATASDIANALTLNQGIDIKFGAKGYELSKNVYVMLDKVPITALASRRYKAKKGSGLMTSFKVELSPEMLNEKHKGRNSYLRFFQGLDNLLESKIDISKATPKASLLTYGADVQTHNTFIWVKTFSPKVVLASLNDRGEVNQHICTPEESAKHIKHETLFKNHEVTLVLRTKLNIWTDNEEVTRINLDYFVDQVVVNTWTTPIKPKVQAKVYKISAGYEEEEDDEMDTGISPAQEIPDHVEEPTAEEEEEEEEVLEVEELPPQKKRKRVTKQNK